MNNVLIFTIIVALLVGFVAFPMASGDNGLGKGHVIGEGHTNFPGQGLGKGHAIHECDPTCPLCGGNPHIPPCTGV